MSTQEEIGQAVGDFNSAELMKKIEDAGFRIVEVPVHHYHRAFGKSQFFNFRRIFKTGIDVGKLWWQLVVRKSHLKRSETVTV